MNKKPKALSGSKYVFLNYLKGDIFAWLTNNTNYKTHAANDSMLREASNWRWDSVNMPWGTQVPWYELPTQMIDGLTAGEYIKEYYKKIYPNHLSYDVDVEEPNWNNKAEYTKKLINENKTVIIFEPLFEHVVNYEGRDVKFRIKGDILIKTDGKYKLVEAKGVGTPLIYHAIDVKYQQEIIKRAGYDVESWEFKLGIMNKNFTTLVDPLLEVDDLFSEVDFYFNSRPKNIEEGLLKQKDLSLNTFLNNDYKEFKEFVDFDETLNKLIEIQLMDNPPIEGLKSSFNKYLDSEYTKWVLIKNGVPKINSVFSYGGDSGFNFDKKINLFNEGYKMIDSVPNYELSSFIDEDSDDEKLINEFKNSEPKKIKRIIQKEYLNKNEPFVLKEKIVEKLLTEYDIESGRPIIMYDFETISMAVPMTKGAWPYEQVPYQFSAHIITDPKNFNIETNKNIEHYEWLTEEKENMVINFWKEFTSVMFKYPNAIFVSFNKSFENAIMKNAIDSKKQQILNMDEEIIKKIVEISSNTIDLMEFFSEKYYYHKDFHGSYSIKVIVPHFAPEINYKDLDERVQKGDQSALQAKIWLLGLRDKFDENGQLINSKYFDRNHVKSNEYWNNIRKPMLKYCEYDTLSMVIIFKKLLELI